MLSFKAKKLFPFLVAGGLILIAAFGIVVSYQQTRFEEHQLDVIRSSGEAPVALLSATEHDWGEIARDKPVSQDFTLENPSEYPLEVTLLVTSCGCTTAELLLAGEKQEIPALIPPESSAEIHVVFDPAIHTSRGVTRRAVRIETNDPENPFLIINLLADVQ